MPGPTTRAELEQLVRSSFEKLTRDLDAGGARAGSLPCVDDWTVKDVLAIRAWWSDAVVSWIEAGKSGEVPVTPEEGYAWSETPRLNADIARRSRRRSYRATRAALEEGYDCVLRVVAALRDDELLETGVFEWAGKWPVARWIAINTARQYATARTMIRAGLARGA